jgi:hypothetical protein
MWALMVLPLRDLALWRSLRAFRPKAALAALHPCPGPLGREMLSVTFPGLLLDPEWDGFGWCELADTIFYSTAPMDWQEILEQGRRLSFWEEGTFRRR